jgi:hypothetical protein
MRWLVVTVALLCASAALVAGIYLRDRDASWQPPQRDRAAYDARMVMALVAGPDCGKRCSYTLLANPRDSHWLARIVDRSRTECVDIDVLKFDTSRAHGISGVTAVGCDPIGAPVGS